MTILVDCIMYQIASLVNTNLKMQCIYYTYINDLQLKKPLENPIKVPYINKTHTCT